MAPLGCWPETRSLQFATETGNILGRVPLLQPSSARQNLAQTGRHGAGCIDCIGCISACLLGDFLTLLLRICLVGRLRCSPLYTAVFGLEFAYSSGKSGCIRLDHEYLGCFSPSHGDSVRRSLSIRTADRTIFLPGLGCHHAVTDQRCSTGGRERGSPIGWRRVSCRASCRPGIV